MKNFLIIINLLAAISCEKKTTNQQKIENGSLTQKEIFVSAKEYMDGYFEFVNIDSIEDAAKIKFNNTEIEKALKKMNSKARLKAIYNIAIRNLDTTFIKLDSTEYKTRILYILDSLTLKLKEVDRY